MPAGVSRDWDSRNTSHMDWISVGSGTTGSGSPVASGPHPLKFSTSVTMLFSVTSGAAADGAAAMVTDVAAGAGGTLTSAKPVGRESITLIPPTCGNAVGLTGTTGGLTSDAMATGVTVVEEGAGGCG